jgi:transposase
MGKERGFRAYSQAVEQRSRQRIHDDRCYHCTRSSTQRRCAKKNGAQAIGRSRGGLTTKVHALVDALGNPVNLMLTPGQDHDLTCAQPLLENADPGALIGDKAYDADSLIDRLNQRAITAVIPPRANRKVKRDCDFALYRERNLVERFFNKIKHYRAIATRYDKLAQNFLAAVQLVAAIILLN